jgi:hypothetical protein
MEFRGPGSPDHDTTIISRLMLLKAADSKSQPEPEPDDKENVNDKFTAKSKVPL